MKNNLISNMRKEILFGVIFLICMSSVSAFAISSPYWSGNSLTLNAGESTDVIMVLQNLAGTSDIQVKAVITEGSSLVKIADESSTYIIPAGGKTTVTLEATVPSNAETGQVYDVKIDFSEMKETGSGEFGLGTAIGQRFSIIVGERLEEGIPAYVYVIAGIIFVLIIIAIILAKKFLPGKKSRRK